MKEPCFKAQFFMVKKAEEWGVWSLSLFNFFTSLTIGNF